MDIGIRLEKIASMVEKCKKIVDVGTDHAYIPIYLVKNNICETAIASDINKGPVEKAKLNIQLEGLENKIECRIGGGLTTVSPCEIQCSVIAGMGGNLIRDIIEESMEIFKSLDYSILQPVQNPEVLREYIYRRGYKILDEELCIEEGKFYEIIKAKYDQNPVTIDPIYYEISKNLIDKKHPLIKEYINHKLEKYYKIYNLLNDNTPNSKAKKIEVMNKLGKLKELCLL